MLVVETLVPGTGTLVPGTESAQLEAFALDDGLSLVLEGWLTVDDGLTFGVDGGPLAGGGHDQCDHAHSKAYDQKDDADLVQIDAVHLKCDGESKNGAYRYKKGAEF